MTVTEPAALAGRPGPGCPAVIGDPGPAVMGDPAAGRFGPFGGRFVPEALIPACAELDAAFRSAWADRGFRAELDRLLAEYAGRPTPLTVAPRLSADLGLQVLLKREDLAHTGSHKINNVAGQALLARRMGKTALVAETGAGQHGVAAATVAAHLGLGCTVYMGARDMARQELNVFRMELLGATVVPVHSGSRTLKDATNEALRHWVTTVDDTHYCIGSVLGPHPYPWLVRELQRVIGDEARAQCAALSAAGRLPRPVPDVAVACVGGGSNAAGTFAGFARQPGPAGRRGGGRRGRAEPAASPACCTATGPGFCRTRTGRSSRPSRSPRAWTTPGWARSTPGWPRPGGPSTTPSPTGRRSTRPGWCARAEGILPALESAHALAWVRRAARAGDLAPGSAVLITVSGRGDKDAAQLKELTRGRG